jgi:DNA modification methylase
VTLLTLGPLDSPERIFHRPDDMPRGRNGQIYATDVWDDIPEQRRNGLLRYDTALPAKLVARIIVATTDEGDLVGDPFLGSGTTPEACLRTRRRCFAGDLNPQSLAFTQARLLAETIPALQTQQVALFDLFDSADVGGTAS